MILVMEPIRDQMRMKPRYWKRLYSVLCEVLQGDTPVLILQVDSVTNCMIYLLSRHYQKTPSTIHTGSAFLLLYL